MKATLRPLASVLVKALVFWRATTAYSRTDGSAVAASVSWPAIPTCVEANQAWSIWRITWGWDFPRSALILRDAIPSSRLDGSSAR